MASLYDRADIYDLIEDENRHSVYKKHWEKIMENRHIETLLDVSIGSGNVTLPLSELGVSISGSDLSSSMLENCAKNARNKNININLQCCDFREVSKYFSEKFDCIASTGNSLPHVDNDDVLKTLEQMDLLVKPGGYLYFDTRNWDKILKGKNRFYLYNPFFKEDTRINLTQVWDYNTDGSMTFHLLYTFEKNNEIFQREHFEERYIPILREKLVQKLKSMGYSDIKIMNFPSTMPVSNVNDMDWYCVVGRK